MKKYEKYIDSGVNWIGKVPLNWNKTQLKYISTISKGRKASEDFQDYSNGLIPYLSMEYLRGQTENPLYVSKDDQNIVLVEENDLLILWDGSKAGEIVPAKMGALSSTMGKIHIVDKEISLNFLNYYLKNAERYIQSNTVGMGIPHVDGDILKTLLITFPELNEQIQIARYLDHQTSIIDQLIQKKERLIELLKEKRQSIINEAVTKGLNPKAKMKDCGIEWLGEVPEGWSYSKLKWIAEIFAGGTPNTSIDEYWENGTIPWLNSGSVNQKRINVASEFITEEAVKNSSTKWVPKGALLMALAGQGKTKGTVAILEIDATCNQSMAAIVPDGIVNNEYLFFWLHVNYERIRGLAGSEQRDGLNLQIIGDIFCPLPNIIEQLKIVKYLNDLDSKIDTSILKITDQIEKLKEYRQSIISEAVTGKIDVRDWQPNKEKVA